MDRREILRDKLAEVTSSTGQSRRTRWEHVSRRLRDLWGRFTDLSLVEKTFVVGCLALVLILLPIAVLLLAGRGGGEPASAGIGLPGATREPPASLIATPTESPLGDAPTATPFNRRDCDEIRGTDFLSAVERVWFQQNCQTPTPEPTGTATPRPSATNPPSGPGDPAPAPAPTAAAGTEPHAQRRQRCAGHLPRRALDGDQPGRQLHGLPGDLHRRPGHRQVDRQLPGRPPGLPDLRLPRDAQRLRPHPAQRPRRLHHPVLTGRREHVARARRA
jgi:hypothetical protein